MDANPFDLAAQFCKQVSVPSLLEYLGVTAQSAPTEVAEKLKARRKYMQGMQANPKYRVEAISLIKHFAALSESLVDPRVYAEDVQRRSESGHLAVLEMAIRDRMKAGPFTAGDEQFLRRNARQLRISERSYERLLRRLAAELGTELPLPPPTPSLVPQETSFPPVTSVAPVATPSAPPPAPPDGNDTAPPIRPRTGGPAGDAGLPARLELLGDPVHKLDAQTPGVLHIAVRNRGSGPMPATVASNVPWLVVLQANLDPHLPVQTIEVRLAPALVGRDRTGEIEIQAGTAGSAIVKVCMARRSYALWWAALGFAAATCAVIGLAAMSWMGARSSTLVVRVDPVGTVSLAGEVIGTGTSVRVEHPVVGQMNIAVEGGPNFQPWSRTVEVREGHETVVEVELQLARPIGEAAAGEAPGCEDVASRRAVGGRLSAMKRCLAKPGSRPTGLRVRVGAEGHSVGMDLDGEGLSAATRRCIERQVAAFQLEPVPPTPCIVAFEIPRP